MKELILVLEKLIVILKNDGETHWSKWLTTSMVRLQNSDYSGVEHLLGAYGGMGSLSDLIVGQSYKDGRFEWKSGAKKNNNKLDSLRSEAYNLADFIKQNHEIKKS